MLPANVIYNMVKIKSSINDKSFTVVSFYTFDPVYEASAKKLIASLETFSLDYYIEGIPALGDWKTCTDYKATFIRRAIDKVSTPIVWVDADATIVQYPKLFETIDKKIDILAFINHINNLLSGTLYFANNDKVRLLMDNWVKSNSKNTVLFEQKILQKEINKNKDIVFRRLPIGYCQIYDYKVQAKDDDKYIMHWQASRKTKHKNKALSDKEVARLVDLIQKETNNN